MDQVVLQQGPTTILLLQGEEVGRLARHGQRVVRLGALGALLQDGVELGQGFTGCGGGAGRRSLVTRATHRCWKDFCKR